MSTNFPTSLDSYAALVDNTDDVLAAHPNNRGDAIEAIEAKVGVDGSAVATSHDKKIDVLETAVRSVPLGGTGAATLTNHGILLGSAAGPITPTAVMSNGQLLVGQTTADPLPKTISGDITVSAAGVVAVVSAATGSIDQTAIGAGAIHQSEMDVTAIYQTVAIANASSSLIIMTGSMHGLFGVQVKCTNAGATLAGTFDGFSAIMIVGNTSYHFMAANFTNSGSISRTFAVNQNYITASGEVFWYFVMRDKVSKKIYREWAAPDHPSFFANTNNPEDTPYPVGWNFDPDIHEIIVAPIPMDMFENEIIPLQDEDKGIGETLQEFFDLDDSEQIDYPDIPVTVGMPHNWKYKAKKEKAYPDKVVIIKPDMVKTAILVRKQNESG